MQVLFFATNAPRKLRPTFGLCESEVEHQLAVLLLLAVDVKVALCVVRGGVAALVMKAALLLVFLVGLRLQFLLLPRVKRGGVLVVVVVVWAVDIMDDFFLLGVIVVAVGSGHPSTRVQRVR